MPLISQTLGAAALSLVVQGMPLHADYLRSTESACEMSARTAQQWQKQGRSVVQQRIGQWCVSGTVEQGQWIAEQWRDMTSGAQGWRIRIPLSNMSGQTALGLKAWGVDVIDPAIESRIRYRQSFQTLDQHHRDSAALIGVRNLERMTDASHPRKIIASPFRLTQLERGAIVLSGHHPDGGSYSVVIERGVTK